MFDDEEWEALERAPRRTARELRAEKARARGRGARAATCRRCSTRGAASRSSTASALDDSPAYRLNHEEVVKSLEEGVRYVEHMSPIEAVLDERAHVKAMTLQARGRRASSSCPARTVCVAAGTSPNVTYEKEYPGTFELDERKQYFQPHAATVDADGRPSTLAPASDAKKGFFTSYLTDGRTVSFYGDNHPHYAGSVVKAMASAKDGYPHVVALFPESRGARRRATQPARDADAGERSSRSSTTSSSRDGRTR